MSLPVEPASDIRQVCCPVCYYRNKVAVCTTRGDPRNIAYIGIQAFASTCRILCYNAYFFAGHWDGWQPFNKPSHGCGKLVINR